MFLDYVSAGHLHPARAKSLGNIVMQLTVFVSVRLPLRPVPDKQLENTAMLQIMFVNALHPLIPVLEKLRGSIVTLQMMFANALYLSIHVLDKVVENTVSHQEIMELGSVNAPRLLKHAVEQHQFVAMVFALEVIFMI